MSGENIRNKEPYQVIEDFFSFATLRSHRKYVTSVLEAAYSEDYWRKSDPGTLLLFQELMEDLMRATYIFIRNKNKKLRRKEVILTEEFAEISSQTDNYGRSPEMVTIWDFFPRSLSKKEFRDPYLAFEKFFEYQALDEWIVIFKKIVMYALSPYGNESALEIDFLKVNNLFQKLIDASHLIHVRIKKKDLQERGGTTSVNLTHESATFEIATTKEEKYICDPYKIIDRFFMDGDIEGAREDINRLFEAAFPDELIVKKHYPSVLAFAFERIQTLVNAAMSLNQEPVTDVIDEVRMESNILTQIKILIKKTGGWQMLPFKLKPQEWIYPRLVIKAFFEHQPLFVWNGKLHEIFQAAISDRSICSIISDRSRLHKDCDHLERLLEAMWIIRNIKS